VALLKRMFDGSLPAAARISFVLIDVRDVAAAHVAAMTAPEARGQRFVMVSGTYSLMKMADVLRAAMPERAAKMPRFEVPDWIVRIVGVVDKDVRGNLGELGVVKTANSAPAEHLLGRALIGPDEAVIASGRTLVAHGIA